MHEGTVRCVRITDQAPLLAVVGMPLLAAHMPFVIHASLYYFTSKALCAERVSLTAYHLLVVAAVLPLAAHVLVA